MEEKMNVGRALIAGALLTAIPAAAQAQEAAVPLTGLDRVCQESQDKPNKENLCPRDVREILPDAATAYAVGIAILKARYRADVVRRYRYEAQELPFRPGEWCLMRQWPKGFMVKGGGHPYLCLSRKDGRVMFIGISA
jgi:hypothetical protein